MDRQWTEGDWQEIDGLLAAGDKIAAIKLYRERSGADLKTAKDAVEARAAGAAGRQAAAPTGDAAGDWQAVDAALFAGRKIEAIKRHRERAGLGLKEAKDVVEARERELRERVPNRFASPPGRGGCVGLLAMVLVLTVATAWLLGHAW